MEAYIFANAHKKTEMEFSPRYRFIPVLRVHCIKAHSAVVRRRNFMVNTIRLYIDASYAVAIMACVGIVSGFATAGLTGNTERSLQVALGMFALTGAVLTVRLWWVMRKTSPAVALPPRASD
jgi:hypothetical protein